MSLQKVLLLGICLFLLAVSQEIYAESKFTVVRKPLPEWVVVRMKRYSWHEGCPVPLQDLTYLLIKHWGFDGKIHDGRLVLHKQVADDVIDIFKILFTHRFPIEKMNLIENYQGSDDASMADNNTSAFNCRSVTGKPGVFSKHSYGLALDINPLVNPYIVEDKVYPPQGRNYIKRNKKAKGMIVKGGIVYQAFTKRGWIWGGNWKTVKDYQHFEKRLD